MAPSLAPTRMPGGAPVAQDTPGRTCPAGYIAAFHRVDNDCAECGRRNRAKFFPHTPGGHITRPFDLRLLGALPVVHFSTPTGLP
jgi:hypothetical protein